MNHGKETKPDLTLKEELKRLLPGPRVQVAWLVLAAVISCGFTGRRSGTWSVTWWAQEDYQHGFFVPIFALFLLWLRRDMIGRFSGRGSLVGIAVLRRVGGDAVDGGLLQLRHACPNCRCFRFSRAWRLFVGGWQGLRWAWPAILFLFFMMPLPGDVQGMASQQLQTLATRISVFVIQTLGIPAVAQGNVIQLTEQALGSGAGVQRAADDDAVLRHLHRRGVRVAQAACGSGWS